MFKKIKNFTLIELVTVIVVLGILAAIVVPNVKDFKKDATISAANANLVNIQTAVDVYTQKNFGALPVESKLEDPQPLDVAQFQPELLRTLPKLKGYNVWIDYWGQVFYSEVDAPKSVVIEEGKLSWEEVEGAESYNVYKVVEKKQFSLADFFFEKAFAFDETNSVKKFITNTKDTNYEVPEDGLYVISSIDSNGFETAASGRTYQGYVSPNASIDSGNVEEPVEEVVELGPLGSKGKETFELAGDTYVKPLIKVDENNKFVLEGIRADAFKVSGNGNALVWSKGKEIFIRNVEEGKDYLIYTHNTSISWWNNFLNISYDGKVITLDGGIVLIYNETTEQYEPKNLKFNKIISLSKNYLLDFNQMFHLKRTNVLNDTTNIAWSVDVGYSNSSTYTFADLNLDGSIAVYNSETVGSKVENSLKVYDFNKKTKTVFSTTSSGMKEVNFVGASDLFYIETNDGFSPGTYWRIKRVNVLTKQSTVLESFTNSLDNFAVAKNGTAYGYSKPYSYIVKDLTNNKTITIQGDSSFEQVVFSADGNYVYWKENGVVKGYKIR